MARFETIRQSDWGTDEQDRRTIDQAMRRRTRLIMKSPRGSFGPDGATVIEVETTLLEQAKQALGVRTGRRAVELALREVVRSRTGPMRRPDPDPPGRDA